MGIVIFFLVSLSTLFSEPNPIPALALTQINWKFEARNTKYETNPKSECSNVQNVKVILMFL